MEKFVNSTAKQIKRKNLGKSGLYFLTYLNLLYNFQTSLDQVSISFLILDKYHSFPVHPFLKFWLAFSYVFPYFFFKREEAFYVEQVRALGHLLRATTLRSNTLFTCHCFH